MDLVSLFLAPDWDNLAFEEALDRSAPGDDEAAVRQIRERSALAVPTGGGASA